MATTRRPPSEQRKTKAGVAGKPPAPAPAKKKVAAKTAAAGAAKPAGLDQDANAPKGLIQAGLKAFGTVRDDVVMRQSNMIDSLLGIGAGKASPRESAGSGILPRSLKSLDPFGGLSKFEDVFNQRVAVALQQLGLPSPEDVLALQAQVQQLREEVEALKRAIAAASGADGGAASADARPVRRKR